MCSDTTDCGLESESGQAACVSGTLHEFAPSDIKEKRDPTARCAVEPACVLIARFMLRKIQPWPWLFVKHHAGSLETECSLTVCIALEGLIFAASRAGIR